jgi:hypothetical protein
MEQNPVLCFRTMDQVVLFKHELKGQLSDGYWENATPDNHYQIWCRAQVIQGTPGRNFYAAKCNYNFIAKDLLDAEIYDAYSPRVFT